MLYYKVVVGDVYDHQSGYTTVKDELVTPKERARQFPTLSDKCFESVDVCKRNTVWWFGCRFEG